MTCQSFHYIIIYICIFFRVDARTMFRASRKFNTFLTRNAFPEIRTKVTFNLRNDFKKWKKLLDNFFCSYSKYSILPANFTITFSWCSAHSIFRTWWITYRYCTRIGYVLWGFIRPTIIADCFSIRVANVTSLWLKKDTKLLNGRQLISGSFNLRLKSNLFNTFFLISYP